MKGEGRVVGTHDFCLDVLAHIRVYSLSVHVISLQYNESLIYLIPTKLPLTFWLRTLIRDMIFFIYVIEVLPTMNRKYHYMYLLNFFLSRVFTT